MIPLKPFQVQFELILQRQVIIKKKKGKIHKSNFVNKNESVNK